MRVSRNPSALALAMDAATAFVLPPGNKSALSDKSLRMLGPLLRAHMKSLSTSLVVACPLYDPLAPEDGHFRTF